MKASTSFGLLSDRFCGIITCLEIQSLIMVYEVIIHKKSHLGSGLTLTRLTLRGTSFAFRLFPFFRFLSYENVVQQFFRYP